MKRKIRKVRDLRTVHFGLQTQNEQGCILLASGDTKICGFKVEGRNSKEETKSIVGLYDVNIIPNPSKDRIAVFVKGALPNTMIHLQIFDVNGKKVKEIDVLTGDALPTTFSLGLYFCQVIIGGNQTQLVKFTIIP
jgi:hypothetical protein